MLMTFEADILHFEAEILDVWVYVSRVVNPVRRWWDVDGLEAVEEGIVVQVVHLLTERVLQLDKDD